MSGKIIVLVTAGNMENAENIARTLIEERLAACVNIVPRIRSFYRWEGKIVDDEELLLIIKTRRDLFPALKEKVLSLHAYELPEIVELDIIEGHEPYLDWIGKETR